MTDFNPNPNSSNNTTEDKVYPPNTHEGNSCCNCKIKKDLDDLKKEIAHKEHVKNLKCRSCVYCTKQVKLGLNAAMPQQSNEPPATIFVCELGYTQDAIEGITPETPICNLYNDAIRDVDLIKESRNRLLSISKVLTNRTDTSRNITMPHLCACGHPLITESVCGTCCFQYVCPHPIAIRLRTKSQFDAMPSFNQQQDSNDSSKPNDKK